MLDAKKKIQIGDIQIENQMEIDKKIRIGLLFLQNVNVAYKI